MKLRLTGIIFLLFTTLLAQAADGEYAVSKIPAALLKNAHSVVRVDQGFFEIYSLTKTRYRVKSVITVLNENADHFGTLVVGYDKLSKIESIDGKLYDAAGKELKSVKNKDIKDYSSVDDGSLMDDGRVKVYEFHHRQYPYTVEFEYEIVYNNTFMFPNWYVQPRSNQSVEYSLLTVQCPQWFKFNHRTFNFSKNTPVISGDNDKKTYQWRADNLPALLREFSAPDRSLTSPSVFFSPEEFEIQGYKGSMNSWKEFGQFIAKLNEGRDKLPDNIKKTVHDLTDGISDTREKVKVLYEYMQKNTRYISVQLGIGGWQTYEAEYVATRSYGDCKALSNYMYSLLKEANIKSCYTLVYAGEEDNFFIPDFTYNRFNHIILCVPMPKDTIWLECTSQTLPAGYLSGFTSDRHVLAITEEGGKLVTTPRYGLKDNIEKRTIRASLLDDATLKINVMTSYTGLQQDFYQRSIQHRTNDKVREWLSKRFDLATYDVKSFDYKEYRSAMPSVLESIELEAKNYATMTGRRLFVAPNVLTRHDRKLSADSTRKNDIEFITEYRQIDSVEIALPAGYNQESMPKDIEIKSKFGKYNSSVKFSGNTLKYYRSMEHYSGLFPAKDYPELVSFYESVFKADRNKVVLVKNEDKELKGF